MSICPELNKGALPGRRFWRANWASGTQLPTSVISTSAEVGKLILHDIQAAKKGRAHPHAH